MSAIQDQLIVMGEPTALIQDYLDSTDNPSIDGFFAYKKQEESAYSSQVQWDSMQQKAPVLPSSSITGNGIAGLMSNLKK